MHGTDTPKLVELASPPSLARALSRFSAINHHTCSLSQQAELSRQLIPHRRPTHYTRAFRPPPPPLTAYSDCAACGFIYSLLTSFSAGLDTAFISILHLFWAFCVSSSTVHLVPITSPNIASHQNERHGALIVQAYAMTSRPSLAISQRQPQRSLSGSGLSQRPATQRSLSQQYLPQSPIRRSDSFNNEQGSDGGDGAQNRYGTTPRRGGSKLKLELANDGIIHAGFVESPQNPDPLSANKVFTPSRVMSMTDAPDLGDMSPQTSRCQTADMDSTPLPMPPRRARFSMPTKRFQPPPTNAPVKKDARTKPFVLEAPPEAPKYSTMGKQEPCGRTRKNEGGPPRYTDAFSGHADFNPWRGGHPEDQFSDNIIRIGYFDKAPAPAAQELASAKAILFPALKHKTGLHTLSSIFTSILNQRRHIGQITAPSTFKPPPRVTLTDTKREAWLKDLANSTIPLRRLSRTIPHGIRGRVLLDQCLNKNVPTDRAVWLAKCVGANEIRAFKRKGVNNTFVMGGEVKWIRDWTLCVEQFIETVISAFNEEDWKAKVTYA